MPKALAPRVQFRRRVSRHVYMVLLVGAAFFAIIIAVSLKRSGPRKKISFAKVKREDQILSQSMTAQVSAKVTANCYKGIFYLNLAQLPTHRKHRLLQWGALRTIKIKTESVLLTEFIQYDKYENWYNEEYKQFIVIREEHFA